MLDTSKLPEGYLDEVKAFADKVGKRQSLDDQLGYLEKWGEKDGVYRYDVMLYKDFAPYSFEFTIVRIGRTFTEVAHKCKKCGEIYWCEPQYPLVPWDQCYKYECQAKGEMEIVAIRQRTVERGREMNGGVIFHGTHDGGGNGGAPTFSVCLSPTDGWSIHT